MVSNKTTDQTEIDWPVIGGPIDEDSRKKLKRLQKEHDNLLEQVTSMASFNYAREPDFVRDRNKLRGTLDEVANLKRRVQSQVNHISAIFGKARNKVHEEAKVLEAKSEQVIRDGLSGNMRLEDLVGRYTDVRRKAIGRGIIAEKLINGMGARDANGSSIIANSKTVNQQDPPTPTPRLKKRMSLVT